MKYFYSVLLFIFIPVLTWAQSAATIVKVDSLKPGDVFDYIIIVKKNQVYEKIAYPDSNMFGEDFEISSLNHYKPNSGTDSIVYKLQFFGVGENQLPELPIHLINGVDTTTLFSDVVPVFYKTLVEDEKPDSMKPLKPIYEFASLYGLYIIAVLLLLVMIWFIYKKYVAKKGGVFIVEAKEPAVFKDPFKELERRLEEIKSSDELKEGSFKFFYTDLGDAIRLYIERVYGDLALEMTTSEIKYALQKRCLDPQLQNMIMLVLSQADQVKFAKYTPTIESAFDDLERAFELAKKFRENDKSKVANLRYQFEIDNGLRKPEEEKSDDLG